MIHIDGSSLTLADLASIADGGESVDLDPAAARRVDAARAVVDRKARGDEPVYGINTGFGALAETPVARDVLGELQVNLLRSHAAGVGDPLPVRAVRATMALRVNVLAKGFSGIRRETLERLIALLNRRVHPRVPSRGSVGASGDLAPLAHLALVLIGEGEAWVDGSPTALPGRDALSRAGLQPIQLEAKEGLALINGTQFSTALAVLACVDARRLWEAGMAAAALSTEVLMGSFQPARPEVQALRPYPGALEAARRLRAYSEDSALVASHADCGRVQDAYSLRCVPQVMGASWDALAYVESQLAVEVNSVNDNPLVFAGSGEVISAGLFHAQPVALAADILKIAVAEVASLAERRIDRLLDERVSGLPAVLAGQPGLESGYMLAQYTAAALVSENKTLCHPASVDSIPTGAGMEDHVSMAPIAGRHARQVVDNAANVVALELMCAARALEFRRPLRAGLGSERLYGLVRRVVPEPEGDRPLSNACEMLARWVLSTAPVRLADEVLS